MRPVCGCALTALKQDPAAQLDKRCARPYILLGDVKLNAASAPIHSCWHPRPLAADLAAFAIKLMNFAAARYARILAADDEASMQRATEKYPAGITSRRG